MRVAVLTISDRSYHGERADKTGPAVAEAVRRLLPGASIVEQTILPDERDDIEWNLKRIADTASADLVLTAGGTGPNPTPGVTGGTGGGPNPDPRPVQPPLSPPPAQPKRFLPPFKG